MDTKLSPLQASSDAGHIITLVLRRTASEWERMADELKRIRPDDEPGVNELRLCAAMRRQLD